MSNINKNINVINTQDCNGNTPLHTAIENKDKNMIHFLLNIGVDSDIKNNDGKTPMHLSFDNFDNSDDIYELLLNKIDNKLINARDNDGNTYLHKSMMSKNYTIVKKLLNNCDVNVNVNITNNDNKTPLCYYYTNDDIEIFNLFIKHKVEINLTLSESKNTLLHIAVINCNEKLVKLLLDNKCKLDITNSSGMTPFHIAVENKSMNIAKLLIKNE